MRRPSIHWGQSHSSAISAWVEEMRQSQASSFLLRLILGIMGDSAILSSSSQASFLLSKVNTTEVIFFFSHRVSCNQVKRVRAWKMKADSWRLKDSVKTTTMIPAYQKGGQRLNIEIEQLRKRWLMRQRLGHGTMPIVLFSKWTQVLF